MNLRPLQSSVVLDGEPPANPFTNKKGAGCPLAALSPIQRWRESVRRTRFVLMDLFDFGYSLNNTRLQDCSDAERRAELGHEIREVSVFRPPDRSRRWTS
jgi:hypothetical protein